MGSLYTKDAEIIRKINEKASLKEWGAGVVVEKCYVKTIIYEVKNYYILLNYSLKL